MRPLDVLHLNALEGFTLTLQYIGVKHILVHEHE